MWTRSPRSSTERGSSRYVRAGLAAILAAGLCLAPGALRARSSPSPDEIRQRARSVVDRDFQRQLPSADAADANTASPEEPASDVPCFGALVWGFALVTLVVLGIVVLVLAVIWLVRNWRSLFVRSPSAAATTLEIRIAEAKSPETAPGLGDAERLAAQGRWGDAVHALLLLAIRQLCERFSIPLASSRTSRELCRAFPLQGDAREAFTSLVRTVEVSLFGGVPLGPDDYHASLERFRLLGQLSGQLPGRSR